MTSKSILKRELEATDSTDAFMPVAKALLTYLKKRIEKFEFKREKARFARMSQDDKIMHIY